MNLGGTLLSAALHIAVFMMITRSEPAKLPPKATKIRVIKTEAKPPAATKVEPEITPEPEPKAAPKAAPKAEPKPKPKAQPKTKPEPSAEPRPVNPGAPVDLGNLTLSNEAGNGPAFPAGSEVLPDTEPRPKPAPTPKAKATAQKPKPNVPSCDDEVVKARPTSKIPIEYPQAARELGLEGQVVLRAQIGGDGKVVGVEVLRSAGEIIDQAAVKALEKWEFAPATKCGKSTEGTFTIARRFEMGT